MYSKLNKKIMSTEAKVKKYESALQEIATGETDPKNYRDTVYIMKKIARDAIKDL